ncbi:AraC family transcriptional regulator [Ensifer sp. LCM 4579]|uniref:AraC family transcriptional regulator n=1 Tax=Ensifer sp. LCM 4579 TaxID=1848292 RepID=UPI0008DA93D7|nr:AraC family transcriptional regulator [Ensifer sp. LCM 4579]OHV78717.1 AraC family transcriptional regulator [Ensifer sp. LCM 4579]
MSAQRTGMKLSYIGNDADEIADILARCVGPVNVHMPRKADLSYSYEFIAAGCAAFSRVQSHGRFRLGQKDEVPKLLVLLPLDGSASIDVGRRTLHSAPGKGAVLDGNRLTQVQLDGARRHFSIIFDQSDLIRHISTVLERPVQGSLDFKSEFDLEAGSGLIFFRLAQVMAQSLGPDAIVEDMPHTLEHLSKTLICLLVDTLPHRFSQSMSQGEWLPSPRHVKRAIDFMHANLSSAHTMTQISEAAGIGVRSLQEGFRRFKGKSPTSYLTQLRMEAVHRELTEAKLDVPISEIARKWGFRHMGRFSSDYRKNYGHPPSQARKEGSRS